VLTDRTWEEETLVLIDEARKAEQKAAQRVVSAQTQLESARRDRAALERALELYRKSYGVQEEQITVTPEDAATYRGLTARDTLVEWAARHKGTVVMNELAGFLVAAGLYKHKQQAAGAIYPAAQRGREFEKVDRGVYRLATVELHEQEVPIGASEADWAISAEEYFEREVPKLQDSEHIDEPAEEPADDFASMPF
jgi:hypothetical protein